MSSETKHRAGNPPRPLINGDNAFFFEGLRQRRLLVRACAGCGHLQHPPEPMCGRCNGLAWTTRTCTGRGVLHSYTVHHYPPLAGFDTPHPIALADMEEGFRLLGALHGVRPDDIAIGMTLEVEYVTGDAGDPSFRFVRPRAGVR